MSDTHKNQWVPVSDRLPEYRHTKLVYTECRNTYKASLDEQKQWWNSEQPNVRLRNVTHWMNLPAPPKPVDPFDAWVQVHGHLENDYLAVCIRPLEKRLVHVDAARAIWNAAQGKQEA